MADTKKGRNVVVIKERRITYFIESSPGTALTDEQAIDTAKARHQTQSPLGLLSDDEEVLRYRVGDAEDTEV